MALRRARFAESLARSPRMVWDTAPLIYHLGGLEPWSELTTIAIDAMAAGGLEGVVSTVTVAEMLVRPFQTGNPETVAECETFLLAMPGASIVAPDYAIAHRAASLRGSLGLRMPDALICATALELDAGLITNDASLDRVPELDVLLLSRFIR